MLVETQITFGADATARRRHQVVEHVGDAVIALRAARLALASAAAIPARPSTEEGGGIAIDVDTARLLLHWAQTATGIADRLELACATCDGRHGTQQQHGVEA